MKNIPHLHLEDLPQWAESRRQAFHDQYYAMYSSVLGGIVTDPMLMVVPIDDHMVHRGDGVFETFKCLEGHLYNLDAHLARLERSAGRLEIEKPFSRADLRHLVTQTVRAGGRKDCTVRLFLSRGPGSLGVNPYDSPRAGLYIIATALPPSSVERHPGGATARTSRVPVKHPFFATIKSCNYLPNVLMKKEAVDAGVDYVIGYDDRGCLAEGPTENIGIVSDQRILQVPRDHNILDGTTMRRVMTLAETHIADGPLRGVRMCDIARADVEQASEILAFGTTPDVVPIVDMDGERVGTGSPGPASEWLRELLRHDMLNNRDLLTPAF